MTILIAAYTLGFVVTFVLVARRFAAEERFTTDIDRGGTAFVVALLWPVLAIWTVPVALIAFAYRASTHDMRKDR